MNSEEITKKMTDTTRMMLDSIAELQKISDATVRALAKQQLDAIEEFNAVGTRRVEELTTAKTPKELLATQTKMASEVAKDLKASTMRTMEVLNQSQKELKAFLEKNVKDFIDKTKS